MSVSIFLIWGIWDSILVVVATGFAWMFLERFGTTARNAILAGTALWITIFVILWLALYNMNLATPRIALTALPLAWIEMVGAALIVRWAMRRH